MANLQTSSDKVLCQILWDYLGVRHSPQPADVIIAGGSRDMFVPKEAAQLFRRKLAPLLVVSGSFHTELKRNEADAYAEVAIANGVPKAAIIKERTARNTGQNITLSQEALRQRGVYPSRVILVHTPIVTRRFWATAMAQWKGKKSRFRCHHEKVRFARYAKRPGMEDTIERMLGYVERMESHVTRGFQVYQTIPDKVKRAYNILIARGYIPRGLHD